MRCWERGQTLPIWAFGSLSLLILIAVVVNYGNMLAWQFRAQNAADAAARGVLSVQTSQWNEMIAQLHATAIEEYRIRNILEDMDEMVRGNGGCTGSGGHDQCATMFSNLYYQYLAALQRYTDDAIMLNRVSTTTQSTMITQMQAALTQMQANCGTPSGLDCSFNYTLVSTIPRNDKYLENVYSDSSWVIVGGGSSGNPKTDLTPLKVEVVACANVSNLLANTIRWGANGFNAPAYQAVGRAAATSVMSTQEFMYMGSIVNPLTNNVFQPTEYPESSNGAAMDADGDTYYRIDYGGNPNSTNGNTGNPSTVSGTQFTQNVQFPGFSAFAGWWSAMPIRAFAGALTSGANFTCK